MFLPRFWAKWLYFLSPTVTRTHQKWLWTPAKARGRKAARSSVLGSPASPKLPLPNASQLLSTKHPPSVLVTWMKLFHVPKGSDSILEALAILHSQLSHHQPTCWQSLVYLWWSLHLQWPPLLFSENQIMHSPRTRGKKRWGQIEMRQGQRGKQRRKEEITGLTFLKYKHCHLIITILSRKYDLNICLALFCPKQWQWLISVNSLVYFEAFYIWRASAHFLSSKNSFSL